MRTLWIYPIDNWIGGCCAWPDHDVDDSLHKVAETLLAISDREGNNVIEEVVGSCRGTVRGPGLLNGENARSEEQDTHRSQDRSCKRPDGVPVPPLGVPVVAM